MESCGAQDEVELLAEEAPPPPTPSPGASWRRAASVFGSTLVLGLAVGGVLSTAVPARYAAAAGAQVPEVHKSQIEGVTQLFGNVQCRNCQCNCDWVKTADSCDAQADDGQCCWACCCGGASGYVDVDPVRYGAYDGPPHLHHFPVGTYGAYPEYQQREGRFQPHRLRTGLPVWMNAGNLWYFFMGTLVSLALVGLYYIRSSAKVYVAPVLPPSAATSSRTC